MAKSACDIGNPVYDRSQAIEYGKDTVTVDVWFNGGNESRPTDIFYEWSEVCGGIEVVATLPNLEFEADDIKEDITQTLYEALRPHHIVNIVWLPQISTTKTMMV